MNIKIHRHLGMQSVITEISSGTTKIILDGGANLEENETFSLAQLHEQYNLSAVNAAFLAHYHTDYASLTPGFLQGAAVYASRLCARLVAGSAKYKAKTAPAFAGFYANGTTLVVGDFKITPFLVDEVLYEGYLFLIECEGKTLLYTGDFHANGRKSFEEMLANLPQKVDVLLCEGGILGTEDTSLVTERDLEEQAAKTIANKKGPVFVLLAPTDFDRAATLFHAAKRARRVFLEDLYTAQLASAAGKAMPNPNGWANVKAYLTTGYQVDHPRYRMFAAMPRLAKAEIAAERFVMCIRPGMKKYMKTLNQCMRFQDGVLYNALPEESRNNEATQDFLTFAQSKGLTVLPLRRSGHADTKLLHALVDAVSPSKIFPVAEKDALWLQAEYPKIAVVVQDTLDC